MAGDFVVDGMKLGIHPWKRNDKVMFVESSKQMAQNANSAQKNHQGDASTCTPVISDMPGSNTSITSMEQENGHEDEGTTEDELERTTEMRGQPARRRETKQKNAGPCSVLPQEAGRREIIYGYNGSQVE
mmetsp:Transcript_33987/g.82436  ORF Transcript_33987/g.82436 Transcript_33987/m.82436 type:complete len:130 (-) Transcript_33987:659-1048(-)